MKRVLSLLPSTTEILYMLEAADRLAGVTHECDYPEEARRKPRVTSARIDPSMPSDTIDALVRQQLEESGSLYAMDMDLVRSMAPDLVLTQQLCTVCAVGYATVHAAMRTLADPPIVMNIEPRTLAEVLESFVEIGRQLDLEERATERVAALRERLAAIPPLADAPRVLFLEWLIPPFSAGHWMPELVEAAGAVPVLHNKGEHSRQLSWEAISSADFDVLVVSCCGFGVDRTLQDVQASPELRRLIDERPALRVLVFDGNHYFSRPGPRLVESAEMLNRALVGVDPAQAGSTISRPYLELGTISDDQSEERDRRATG